jgi:hypothetical protein
MLSLPAGGSTVQYYFVACIRVYVYDFVKKQLQYFMRIIFFYYYSNYSSSSVLNIVIFSKWWLQAKLKVPVLKFSW